MFVCVILLAVICILTSMDALMPPADSPAMVTVCGSPPNTSMFSRTHLRAASWSKKPQLPWACSSPVLWGQEKSRRLLSILGELRQSWWNGHCDTADVFCWFLYFKHFAQIWHNFLPQKSQNTEAILNNNHHYVFISSQWRSIILRGGTHCQTSSMDPHHHLTNNTTQESAVHTESAVKFTTVCSTK